MPPTVTSPRFSVIERATLAHVSIFVVGSTWAFGGNALWLRPGLAAWGTAGILITFAAVLGRLELETDLSPLRWLWPFALFNLFVLVSLWVPGFRTIQFGADAVYLPVNRPVWLPIAAVPAEAAKSLWIFDASYLACFNIAFLLHHRRAVRVLVMVAAANALVLSAFGTIQKLVGSEGIFFGRVKVAQPYFFASFIYHNHWAAYAVLMAAACLGLAWRYARRTGRRGFIDTPGPAALLVVLLLAATEPLCASRAGMMLMSLLLLGAFLHWALRLARRRRLDHTSTVLPLGAALLGIAIAGAGIWYLASETITARVELTEEQLSVMRQEGSIGGRLHLYRDTWHMVESRPWFGWGMGSYPYVFMLYNTQEPNRQDHLPIFYRAAHCDWLEALEEHGVIGTIFLAGCAIIPLSSLRRAQLRNVLLRYLLAGCALVLLYSMVEFPFGNVAVALSWWMCFFCAVRYAQLHPAADADAAFE